MPICRRPAALPAPAVEPSPVRLSRYVVHRRQQPRAVNDNRNPRRIMAWHLAVAVAPTVTVFLLLSGLI